MTQLQTKRLRLTPLTPSQLQYYLDGPHYLESVLGFPISQAVLTPVVRRAIRAKIAKMAQVDEERHPWYTYWLIIITHKPYGAGLIGFKGYPNKKGEVEIGYGLDPTMQNNGYTTEAVQVLIGWAFRQPEGIMAVLAETAKSNIASQRVLTKAGLCVFQETADFLYWRLDKNDEQGTGNK
jgi:[ribosomal protein S5]-alanine N-acetyltransferase